MGKAADSSVEIRSNIILLLTSPACVRSVTALSTAEGAAEPIFCNRFFTFVFLSFQSIHVYQRTLKKFRNKLDL